MRRMLVLGLGLLVLCGCAAYRTASTQIHRRFDVLQNPKYPGDANKDLVPYQARNRDAADCHWSKEVQAKTDAVVPPSRDYPTLAAAMADEALWDALLAPFLACMAARGWQ